MIALIATIALFAMMGCGSSRTATRSEAYGLTAYELNRDSLEVTAYSIQDSLVETKTITITKNETGDTIMQSIVTDRLRARSREKTKEVEVRTVVKHDTVFVERRDSLQVTAYGLEDCDISSGSRNLSAVSQILKWVFWIIIAVNALIVTIKLSRIIRIKN